VLEDTLSAPRRSVAGPCGTDADDTMLHAGAARERWRMAPDRLIRTPRAHCPVTRAEPSQLRVVAFWPALCCAAMTYAVILRFDPVSQRHPVAANERLRVVAPDGIGSSLWQTITRKLWRSRIYCAGGSPQASCKDMKGRPWASSRHSASSGWPSSLSVTSDFHVYFVLSLDCRASATGERDAASGAARRRSGPWNRPGPRH